MSKFCCDIHNNLSIVYNQHGVTLSPCCWFDKPTIIQPNKVADLWNIPELTELRELNKTGQLDKGCRQCIYMEAHGENSRRTGVNEYYKNSTATDLSGPRGLEIKIDYSCNIACVYCGPYNSTQWRNELQTPKKTFPIRMKEVDIIDLLEKLDLSNLDNIHFYGGDPLLTNTHEIILDYLDKKVGLGKIYVWYNTNGTIRTAPRVNDLWSKCRLVKVFFSIDDIGPRFEYIRYGASWNQVEENMLWFKDQMPSNVMFTIQPTLSCLNALNHYELIAWKKENFDTNREGDFTDVTRHNVFRIFELNSMPDELMSKCLEKNKSDEWFVSFVQSFKFDPAKLMLTKMKIQELDARRGCNFEKTFPELAPYFL